MRKVLAVSLTAVALCTLAPNALANHTVVKDNEDTPGRLDVRRVEVVGSQPRKWVIKTHNAWRVRGIFDKGYLLVYLDTFGGNRFDYYVLLRPERKKMKGGVWRDVKEGNDFSVAPTKVSRPNRRTVRTTVPFRKLRVPDTQLDYRWHVRTIYSKRSCYRATCMDRAPQFQSVLEPLVP